MIKEQILIGDGRDRGIMQELKSQLKQYNLKYNYIPDDVKEFLIKIDLIENSYKKEYLFNFLPGGYEHKQTINGFITYNKNEKILNFFVNGYDIFLIIKKIAKSIDEKFDGIDINITLNQSGPIITKWKISPFDKVWGK